MVVGPAGVAQEGGCARRWPVMRCRRGPGAISRAGWGLGDRELRQLRRGEAVNQGVGSRYVIGQSGMGQIGRTG